MSRFDISADGFVRIRDYDRAPGFSGFLPGLAGELGTPLWAFTCNRGQGISSFGVTHKGHSILPFQPANLAYEDTPLKGFRTFLRVNGICLEAFSPLRGAQREMVQGFNSLELRELEPSVGLRVTVRYTTLPGEPIGALLRGVRFENTGKEPLTIEALDGLARVLPYGLQLGQYKEMGNLFKSWAQVTPSGDGALLYHLRSSTEDSARVEEITGSFFFASAARGAMLELVYDPSLVFGADAPLLRADAFETRGLTAILAARQHGENRLACAFAAAGFTLAPGGAYELDSLFGFTPDRALLGGVLKNLLNPDYAAGKRRESDRIAAGLLRDMATATSHARFDAAVAQNYLDNFLRGGYPTLMGGKVVHLFSRKHGDPERDYNWFTTAAEPYSQGNGNFRDVCQNRRMDVSLHPWVGDFNVHSFYSLIQMDGYNPLEIRPSRFSFRTGADTGSLLAPFAEEDREKLRDGGFSPGELALALQRHAPDRRGAIPALVEKILRDCGQHFEAGFGEGYWSDHWTYLMDLVEDYLKVYPDRKGALLCGRADYRFFHSGARVRPRGKTSQLTPAGVRRYDALDTAAAVHHTRWLKDSKGEEVTTNLLGKMLVLAATKTASLDPEGLGVSMDGGRPGWNDAMNGLPGLFGSGMPETLELRRHLAFLLALEQGRTTIPGELADFISGLKAALMLEDDFARWDSANTLLEEYRAATARQTNGRQVTLDLDELRPFLQTALQRVTSGIEKALMIGGGIMPTYFTYEASSFEPLLSDGAPCLSASGLPLVRVTAFRRHDVPHFLEGPARHLACGGLSPEEAGRAAAAVRASQLYDQKLGMYLTSVPLDAMGMELGRVRAFTPGWLERESVFLHMAYKYLLGLLKTGQDEAFWQAARTGLVPFMDPDTYGRSTLENSSFIASSRNPDPAFWGRGFVSRLSGSTVEMLSMHRHIFLGGGGMAVRDGKPVFRFAPKVPAFLYNAEGEVTFTLFSACRVTLRRPAGEPDAEQVHSLAYRLDGRDYQVPGDTLPEGEALRQGSITQVIVTMGKGASH